MSQPAPPAPSDLEPILLSEGEEHALVSPARGGLVTRWTISGRDLLYLDEGTLRDPAKNVRGGVPLLFPSPGKLADGRYRRGEVSGSLGQHGFARNLPWRVAAQGPTAVALALADTPETRAQFPWEFELTYRVTLRPSALRLHFQVENRGATPMPFAFGLHPYFAVPEARKSRARVPTAATRAWDNVRKAEVELSGPLDLAAGEVDLHLLDHGAHEAALKLPDGPTLVLRGTPEFTRWVIWTLPGKDFVCLEPWTAPADALNSGKGLLELDPGHSRALWVEFSLPGGSW